MTVPGDEESALVNCYLYLNASDLPAARKASGLHGHTSTWFMCPVCKQPMHSLTDPACFDTTSTLTCFVSRLCSSANPCIRGRLS